MIKNAGVIRVFFLSKIIVIIIGLVLHETKERDIE